MVKLRLKRMGSKFNAFYRVVAADERKNPTGKFIEQIGYYNPHSKELFINEELKTKWIENGAKPSDTVKGLFRKYDANKANAKDGIVTIPVKAKKAKVEASVEETTEA